MLQITCYRLHITDYRVHITYHILHIPYYFTYHIWYIISHHVSIPIYLAENNLSGVGMGGKEAPASVFFCRRRYLGLSVCHMHYAMLRYIDILSPHLCNF